MHIKEERIIVTSNFNWERETFLTKKNDFQLDDNTFSMTEDESQNRGIISLKILKAQNWHQSQLFLLLFFF